MVRARGDLAEVHRLAWEHVAAPGSWFTGAQRVEIATGAAMPPERLERAAAEIAVMGTGSLASRR